ICRVAVRPNPADLEAQELEPVAQPAFADRALAAARIAARRDEVPQAPQTVGGERQYEQLAVGAQHAVHFAQQRVRRLRALKRVRQQYGIDGIARDRELLGIRQNVGAVARPVDERPALRAGITQKRAARPPKADLQQLLAEHALERGTHRALLVGEATPAERGGEPSRQGCRVASHIMILPEMATTVQRSSSISRISNLAPRQSISTIPSITP